MFKPLRNATPPTRRTRYSGVIPLPNVAALVECAIGAGRQLGLACQGGLGGGLRKTVTMSIYLLDQNQSIAVLRALGRADHLDRKPVWLSCIAAWQNK
jgi:hypothetical protein